MKKTVNTKESKSTLTTTNTNKKGAIIMKKTNIRTRIMAAVLSVITLVSATSLCAVTASAETYSLPFTSSFGNFSSGDKIYQDTNYYLHEVKGFVVNYGEVVNGLSAILTDNSAGYQHGSSAEGKKEKVLLDNGDYISSITYNCEVNYKGQSKAISNLTLYTENGKIYGPYGTAKGGVYDDLLQNFAKTSSLSYRLIGFISSSDDSDNTYLTGLGIMLAESARLDADEETAKRNRDTAMMQAVEARKKRSIDLKIDIGSGYICKKQQFYGRKIIGVDHATGKYILGEWEKLFEEGDKDMNVAISANYVEFGYSFDIKGGTDWPYSGIFWQGSTDEIRSIKIVTGGGCRTASINIKVNGMTVLNYGNCSSHRHYDFGC